MGGAVFQVKLLLNKKYEKEDFILKKLGGGVSGETGTYFSKSIKNKTLYLQNLGGVFQEKLVLTFQQDEVLR